MGSLCVYVDLCAICARVCAAVDNAAAAPLASQLNAENDREFAFSRRRDDWLFWKIASYRSGESSRVSVCVCVCARACVCVGSVHGQGASAHIIAAGEETCNF